MTEVQATTPDASLAEQLQSLGKGIDEQFAEARTLFPQVVDELQGQRSKTETTIAQSRAEIEKLEAWLVEEEARRAAGPPPAPEPLKVAIDLQRATLLRDELLSRFGAVPPRPAQGRHPTAAVPPQPPSVGRSVGHHPQVPPLRPSRPLPERGGPGQ